MIGIDSGCWAQSRKTGKLNNSCAFASSTDKNKRQYISNRRGPDLENADGDGRVYPIPARKTEGAHTWIIDYRGELSDARSTSESLRRTKTSTRMQFVRPRVVFIVSLFSSLTVAGVAPRGIRRAEATSGVCVSAKLMPVYPKFSGYSGNLISNRHRCMRTGRVRICTNVSRISPRFAVRIAAPKFGRDCEKHALLRPSRVFTSLNNANSQLTLLPSILPERKCRTSHQSADSCAISRFLFGTRGCRITSTCNRIPVIRKAYNTKRNASTRTNLSLST